MSSPRQPRHGPPPPLPAPRHAPPAPAQSPPTQCGTPGSLPENRCAPETPSVRPAASGPNPPSYTSVPPLPQQTGPAQTAPPSAPASSNTPGPLLLPRYTLLPLLPRPQAFLAHPGCTSACWPPDGQSVHARALLPKPNLWAHRRTRLSSPLDRTHSITGQPACPVAGQAPSSTPPLHTAPLNSGRLPSPHPSAFARLQAWPASP